jgi:hypothetical protein
MPHRVRLAYLDISWLSPGNEPPNKEATAVWLEAARLQLMRRVHQTRGQPVTTEDIRSLYAYDHWANRRVVAAARLLAPEDSHGI